MAISEEIQKLQQDALDLDLQKRLSDVKKNMRGLDSSTDKYNKLVKDVLELQIKRLENHKLKLRNANLADKIPLQNSVTKMEKEIQRQIVSFTKYKLDTKANASLRNKASINLSDLENVFHEFIGDITEVLSETAKSSINLSQKRLFRGAINSKRDKQESYHKGTTGESETKTRQRIAQTEVTKILESEKELADTLKEAFIDIKETINSTESKREFDIQSEKFKLFVEVLEKNRGVINDQLEEKLDQLIKEIAGDKKAKSGLLSTLGGKYADVKADAERLGVTEKLTSAGNSLARGLGKVDSELGNFAEGILAGIEGIDRFAQQLFKIPETFANFKKFFGSLSIFGGGSTNKKSDQTEKLEEINTSINELGQKFTDVINEKTSVSEEEKETKLRNVAGIKRQTKATKEQSKAVEGQNKLMKVTASILALLNIETSVLTKRFALLKTGSFFSGFSAFLQKYSGYILTGALAVYTFGKGLIARTFLRSIGLFRTGIMAIAGLLTNLSRLVLPLLITGLGTLATAIAGLSTPVLLIGGGLIAAAGAILLFPEAVKKAIDYIYSLIPSPKKIWNATKQGVSDAYDTAAGWLDYINPFSSSSSPGQTGSGLSPNTPFGNTGQGISKDKLAFMKNMTAEQHQKVAEYAKKYNVDPNLVYAVIGQESSGKAGAISQTGVAGLMQVTGDTGKSLLGPDFDRKDPNQNLEAGVKYLSVLRERYGGDLNQMMAEYNGGMEYAERAKAGRSYSTGNPAKDRENDGHYAGIKRNYDILNEQSEKMMLAQVQPTPTPRVAFLPNGENSLAADNQKLQSATEKNEMLEYQSQQQAIAKQALAMAQAAPTPAPIINQTVQNSGNEKPFAPVDLRNSENTFVRNMDNDFGLYR